jgi:hypothetical protein
MPRPRVTPGKGPPVPIVQEAGWAPEPVWPQGLEEKSSASVGDLTPVVHSVVRHYTAWATAAANITNKWFNNFRTAYLKKNSGGKKWYIR